MGYLRERLSNGVLLMDSAMGTILHRRGGRGDRDRIDEQIRQRVRGVHFTPRFRRFDLAAEIIGQAKKPEGTT